VKSGGQVRAGQLLGLVGQPRQRPGDGAADQGQEDEPQEGARQAGQAELARLTNGVVVQLRGPLVDDGRDLGVPLLGNGVVARGLARPGAALPKDSNRADTDGDVPCCAIVTSMLSDWLRVLEARVFTGTLKAPVARLLSRATQACSAPRSLVAWSMRRLGRSVRSTTPGRGPWSLASRPRFWRSW